MKMDDLKKENAAFREALEYCGRSFEKRDLANKRNLVGEASKRMMTARFALAEHPSRESDVTT